MLKETEDAEVFSPRFFLKGKSMIKAVMMAIMVMLLPVPFKLLNGIILCNHCRSSVSHTLKIVT